VVFKQYPRFLQAFLSGKVDRLVVVPDLDTEPSRTARSRRGHGMPLIIDNRCNQNLIIALASELRLPVCQRSIRFAIMQRGGLSSYDFNTVKF
jgi:hypothetical protein